MSVRGLYGGLWKGGLSEREGGGVDDHRGNLVISYLCTQEIIESVMWKD